MMARYYVPIAGQTKFGISANLTPAGIALDSNYVHGTGGDAVLLDFIAPETGNLTVVYFYISAVAGTPGNLTVELRNSSSSKPGATAHATQAVSGNATGWVTCTFDTPYQVTQGTRYWVCIGDANGDGTDYATVLWKGGINAVDSSHSYFHGANTTNGNSAVTFSYAPAPLVLTFAGGSIIGMPYTSTAADTSNALTRGMKITGLTEDITIIGVYTGQATSTSVTGVKIFSGTAAPGDTADLTVTSDLSIGYVWFGSPFTLKKNTVYRVVYYYSGNLTAPGHFLIEGTPPADVSACGFGGGTLTHCISDGGTPAAWTDSAVKFPRMALVVADQVNKNVNLLRGKL